MSVKTLTLYFLLALGASCHDDQRLQTGNTGASSTPSDRAQQVGTERLTPTVEQVTSPPLEPVPRSDKDPPTVPSP